MNHQLRKRRRSKMMIIFFIFISSLSSTQAAITRFKADIVMEVSGVQDEEVHIPCTSYSSDADRKVRLIIWYKGTSSSPIYSFDARTANGRHWVDEVALGDRAQFISDVAHPYLRLLQIKPEDEGIYTCRVDYSRQPTRRAKTHLSVIIPPGLPTIHDESGAQVKDDTVGPYNEGSTLEVTCQVVGGKPSPQVIWWRREELLDGSIDEQNSTVLRNTLTIGPLTREHLDAFYVCQASNTDEILPLSKGVTVDVNFKPISVEIMHDRTPLTAERDQFISCQSIGAKPPALMTWWLEDVDLTNLSSMEADLQKNVSLSILSFIPKEEDAGKLLSCKSQSPVMEHEPLVDSMKLDLYYIPKVDLQLDPEIVADDIEEGDNVTLVCNVQSNPEVNKVTWYHKGIMVNPNATAGVKVRKQKLVLKQVERQQAGVYTCVASNDVGEGHSAPLVLGIKYVPVCSDSEDQILGAAKTDNVVMNCRVDASPGAVTFKWYLRSPEETLEIPENKYSIQDRISKLTYHIRTEYDYGDFLCYAANDLGEQATPCIFSVVPAGKPDSLENCTLTNQTTNTLFITCLPGFNGGLDQHFVVVVQAYDDEVRGDILRNATETEEPVFVIEGLQPGASYLLAIYAENIKGRSEDSVLHGFTLPTPPGERITLPSTHIFPITPILGVLIGVVGALVIVAVVVVVVMKLRSDARNDKENPKIRPETNRKGCHAPLQPAKDNDDGPDVILYPSYEDVDGIPPKLKHANIYETVQCDSKENNKNSEQGDSDDVEYAELTFSNGKSKPTKQNKKTGANGAIHSSEDNTIYASIDHTRTAQLNKNPQQQSKQKTQQQQQKQQQQQQQQKQQQQQSKQQDHHHQALKGKHGMDHLETAAQGETDDIPLMDTALESSV